MKKYNTLFLVSLFQWLSAQYYHFEGTIGTDMKVSMDILKTSEDIRGSYFYYSQGQPLNLSGREENGVWKLKEYDLNNNETGNWEIKVSGNQLTGTWFHQAKKFNVNLTENYHSGLKLKNVEMKDEYQVSKDYGLKNYLCLYFPFPNLNPNKASNILKTICDSILSDINLKTKDLNENSIQSEFKKEFERLRSDYEGFIANEKEMCDNAPFTCIWENSQLGYPVFNQNNILSYRNSMYAYNGGAHGTYGTWHTNYNTLNGQMITLETLFKNDSEKNLISLLKTKLKQKYKTNNLDAVNLDEVFVPENIQISFGGIIFHYNPYEIGPYSLGAPEVFIPYSELKPYLANNHPLSWVK